MLEPLELGSIAAAIPPEHSIRVLDLRLSKNPIADFVKELKIYSPDIVGLSGYTHEVAIVKDLAKITRQETKDCFIVVGGHHATVFPQDYNIDCFDAIVRGEGCHPFGEIVQALSNKKPLDLIDNVLFPGDRFDFNAVEKMPIYPDLATIPIPRRDLWDYKRYQCIWPSREHPAWQTIFPPVALVRTSFGCMMDCSFCVVPNLCGRKHLPRPPEMIIKDLQSIKPDHVYFCDDETFINEKHAWEVARAIEESGIKKRYFAWARSTTVNKSPDLFRKWREIGLDTVFLGFEAITDEQLENISKHSTVADNEKAHKTLKDMGFEIQVGFMVNANFSENDFERLLSYVNAMPPTQITFTVYTPSPGSPGWGKEKDTFICDPYALHDCMHPFARTKLPLKKFYKYFAQLVNAGGKRNPLRSPKNKIPPKDIFRIVLASFFYIRALKKAYKDFPKALWK